MDDFGLLTLLDNLRGTATTWLREDVLVMGNLLQVGYLLVSAVLAIPLGKRLGTFLEGICARYPMSGRMAVLRARLRGLSWALVVLVFLWSAAAIAARVGWPYPLLRMAMSLTNAWVIIQLASALIMSPLWSRSIAWIAWSAAAIATLGLMDATLGLLDGLAITYGETRITMLGALKATLAIGLFLWIATVLAQLLEKRIERSPHLSPSLRVLYGKLTRILLIAIAVVVALESVGIDLTAFAVFGGALGVGIGFGLQKIIANFISGIILLLDRSIKPGDVISLDQTYGWVERLAARYTTVRTRDGIEHLIPNEELITQRVENWTHSDMNVRLRVPLEVAYKTDVPLAMELCQAAASSVERVLKTPGPQCLMAGFAENGVKLELRLWIKDPDAGRGSLRSAVYLAIWERFREAEIEIPYPQRDLHIRTTDLPLVDSP